MLISVKELKELYPKFADMNEKLLERKLSAIEASIRKYTNNPFQNRKIRGAYCSKGNKLTSITGDHPFKVGQTVQISIANEGLYVVEEIGTDYFIVDKDLYESMNNLVTLIEYPLDLVDGAINILDWDCFQRDKLGISSETISRHSVSYQQYDGNNTINGYPAMLFGFCEMYKRART